MFVRDFRIVLPVIPPVPRGIVGISLVFYCLLAAWVTPSSSLAMTPTTGGEEWDGSLTNGERTAESRQTSGRTSTGVALPGWAKPRTTGRRTGTGTHGGELKQQDVQPGAPPDFPNPEPVPVDTHVYVLLVAALGYGTFRIWADEASSVAVHGSY